MHSWQACVPRHCSQAIAMALSTEVSCVLEAIISSCVSCVVPDRNTCRRQIQLQSTARLGALPMMRKIMAREGIPGFYRGFLPNALKNLPNKGALSHARVCMAHLGGRWFAHIVRLTIHGQGRGRNGCEKNGSKQSSALIAVAGSRTCLDAWSASSQPC